MALIPSSGGTCPPWSLDYVSRLSVTSNAKDKYSMFAVLQIRIQRQLVHSRGVKTGGGNFLRISKNSSRFSHFPNSDQKENNGIPRNTPILH